MAIEIILVNISETEIPYQILPNIEYCCNDGFTHLSGTTGICIGSTETKKGTRPLFTEQR